MPFRVPVPVWLLGLELSRNEWRLQMLPSRALPLMRFCAPEQSVVQPEWRDDGALVFLSDRSGFWNLYSYLPSSREVSYSDPLPYSAWQLMHGLPASLSVLKEKTTYTRKAPLDPS